jgi:hypothetical protein
MRRTHAVPLYVALTLGHLTGAVCLAQVPGDLLRCTQLADDKNRLECYDEQMTRAGHPVAATSAKRSASVKASPPSETHGTSPAGTSSPKPAASSSAAPDDFGLAPEVMRKKREAESPGAAEPAESTGRVKSVSTRPHGEYRIEMDNGQVWVETLRTGGQPPAVGETVTIRRGALGSFYLTRTAGTALRVKRIQ